MDSYLFLQANNIVLRVFLNLNRGLRDDYRTQWVRYLILIFIIFVIVLGVIPFDSDNLISLSIVFLQ